MSMVEVVARAKGPAFSNHDEALLHFRFVRDWLTANYIEEECEEEPVVGCASCEATALRRDLDMFIREIEDDAAIDAALSEKE